MLQKSTGSQLVKKFPNFIEIEASFPPLQTPATSHYTELRCVISATNVGIFLSNSYEKET